MRQIRPLHPGDDLYAAARVYEQAWRHSYAGMLPENWLAKLRPERWTPMLAAAPGHTLVLLEADRPVGACTFSFSRDQGREGFGEIVSLYLLPHVQGGGEGRRLLEAALQSLHSEGCDGACLWVLEDNKKAIGFYRHMGFETSGRRMKESYGTFSASLVEMVLHW